MTQYIGTKRVIGMPMNRADYNVYRGWELPANENGADEGYLVEYTDGGAGNDPRHQGYISWSPKKQFDDAYRTNGQLTFGDAIMLLKAGHRVTRAGWNGKGMWLMYVSADLAAKVAFEFAAREAQPYLVMKTAQDKIVPWLASQSDMLDEDWMVLV
jgi:hypothetical protein